MKNIQKILMKEFANKEDLEKQVNKKVDLSVVNSRTKWKWLCWFITLLYIIFIIVCTFIKFDTKIIFLNVNGKELSATTEQNLLSLWSAITSNPSLKGLKLYALLFGMGLVSIVIDLILINFVWGGIFSKYQRAINKQSKEEYEKFKEEMKKKKIAKKQLKQLNKLERKEGTL